LANRPFRPLRHLSEQFGRGKRAADKVQGRFQEAEIPPRQPSKIPKPWALCRGENSKLFHRDLRTQPRKARSEIPEPRPETPSGSLSSRLRAGGRARCGIPT